MDSRKKTYRARIKKSLCRGKKGKKCRKFKGCKMAKGTKRSFCRKKKNKSAKRLSASRKSR